MIMGEEELLWIWNSHINPLPYEITTSADELHREPYSYIDYLDDKYYRDMISD